MTKKLILSILVLMLVSFMAFAHPPQKVELLFNKETKVLEITVVHTVKNINTHNIDVIIVFVDGEEFKVINSKVQTNEQKHIVKLEMPNIKSGSIIKVKAKCNKMGAKTATIKI